MEPGFWHNKWQNNEIGFHLGAANPLLTEHFAQLNLRAGARIFLPLCGKTRDIGWLLARGYRIAGAELSELAIADLFRELALAPTISSVGRLKLYRAENIDIWVGDIFDLSAAALGSVDAIYDRAALVALPAEMRSRYAAHLISLTNAAAQLLITYEYDQQLVAGPPFSVSADEVKRHYAAEYELNIVASDQVPGGMRGKAAARETVWLLNKIIDRK